jgi:dTDP-glucose 4,6-dehydratase
MKVLVTGGAGFQGSNLCRALLDRGDCVTILNTLSDRSERNLQAFGLQAARIVWGSITDTEAVHKAVRGHGLVFHLAANIHVDESRERPNGYYQTNVLGTLNVAEECRRNRIPLLHVSTCEVYGGCLACRRCRDGDVRAVTEDCPLTPQSPYAASKAAADRLVYAHSLTYKMPVLILRPGNVFGPGQRHGTRGAVIPIFVQRALTDLPLYIYGDGEQRRDFIYVDDLVASYLHLASNFREQCQEHTWRGPVVFNLGSGESVSIRELAKSVVRIINPLGGVIRHREARPGEVADFPLCSVRALQAGVPKPRAFEHGLIDYIAWFRKHESIEA